MQKERRWLKAVIAASEEPLPTLPWQKSRSTPKSVLQVIADKPARAKASSGRPTGRWGESGKPVADCIGTGNDAPILTESNARSARIR
jgi:hypothetical protein